jgi:hypothetical protein
MLEVLESEGMLLMLGRRISRRRLDCTREGVCLSMRRDGELGRLTRGRSRGFDSTIWKTG